MAQNTDPSLEDRVRRLEQIVDDLQTQQAAPAAASAAPAPSQPTPSPQPTPQPPARRPPAKRQWQLVASMRQADYWLNKLGVALLLLGVVFLFKYSIDRGWITPPVRVAFGLAVGTALLVIGARVHAGRRHFGQVLLGGGIATYYTCGYAAFQLFGLVAQPTAMVFMVLVTLAAFVLAVRQDEAALAVIGALGGLGTPFLLHTETGSVPGLVMYTCVLLAGMMAVYFYRGWRTLMWACTVGGWVVLTIGNDVGGGDAGARWALQLGTAFCWLAFGVLPSLREVAWSRDPARWPRPPFGVAEMMFAPPGVRALGEHVHLACVSSPMIALGLSAAVWDDLIASETWGWLAILVAVAYGAGSYLLRRLPALGNLAQTQLLVGLLLATIGICLVLDGDVRFFALATEAGVLHLIARRTGSRMIGAVAHGLSAVVGLLLLIRLIEHDADLRPLTSAPSLASLWAIVVAGGVAWLRRGTARTVYVLAAHIALAGWLVRELSGEPLLVVLSLQAGVLWLIARQCADEVQLDAAHMAFGLLALWLALRLAVAAHLPFAGGLAPEGWSMADLVPIALAAAISLRSAAAERIAYALGAHIGFLGWLARELARLQDGAAFVTVSWAMHGLALLAIGAWRRNDQLRTLGVLTLLLAVAKLILFDLAQLEAVWRVLLFMGFGGLFLVISYYTRSLWRPAEEE